MATLPELVRVLGVVALLAAGYAGYELIFTARPWHNWVAVAARAWIVVLLGTFGVDETFFGQNALLAAGYLLALPLLPLQVGVVASLVLAAWAWTDE